MWEEEGEEKEGEHANEGDELGGMGIHLDRDVSDDHHQQNDVHKPGGQKKQR